MWLQTDRLIKCKDENGTRTTSQPIVGTGPGALPDCIIHSNGSITCANYTCPAGMGYVCLDSHAMRGVDTRIGKGHVLVCTDAWVLT